MNQLTQYLLPTGILASVGSTIVENPWISSVGEKLGVVCIMGYFLWEKTRECKLLKEEYKQLMERLLRKTERYAEEEGE